MKKKLIAGISLLTAFIIYTYSLTFAFIKPVGPCGSAVAYADINKAVHEFFGVNMTLYNITDWAGVAAIAVAFAFAFFGLIEWIKRKSILKVDKSILLLGVFYLFIFAVYALFEFLVINRRPVLINGILEASYPSSTTMLALCVFPTAIMQFSRLIKNRIIKYSVNGFCTLFTAFMVIGRLLSGVHWLTDIIGGLLFSSAAVLIYWGACDMTLD